MVEQKLQKGMGFLGRIVEKMIGQAKKAKETYVPRATLQPVLALESRLSIPKINQLLDLVANRFFNQALPDLKDKKILEIGEAPLRFHQTLAEKKPKSISGIFVEGTMPQVATGNIPNLFIKGSFKAIPFEDKFFDFVVARLASPHQGDVISAIKEIGRVLAPGGSVLIFDFHPFGLFAKTGTARLKSIQSTVRGLEEYFKMCRLAGLFVTDVREGFIDDVLRSQFTTPDELNAFRDLKGTPLLLFLMATKVKA